MQITDYTDETQKYWREESGNTAILPDITNPRIVQDEENPSILHLTWDNLDIPNFSHYQVRCSHTWNLDYTDKHTKVIDKIKTNNLDFKLLNYTHKKNNIRFWIVAYDLLNNRSKNPVKCEGIYEINVEPVQDLIVKQDKIFRNNILISWQYDNKNKNIERFVITIKEEDCPVYQTSIGSNLREFNDYWARHNSLLTVTVAPQYSNGTIEENPLKNIFFVDLKPKKIENIKAFKDEFGITNISWTDNNYVHQFESEVDYELVIVKEDKMNTDIKLSKEQQEENNYQNGYLENQDTVLNRVIAFYDNSSVQGYEVCRKMKKELTERLSLSEGNYIIQLTPHLHDFYINKDGKRIDYIYKGNTSSICYQVKKEHVS